MGTLLGPKYIPYTYMDPLGKGSGFRCRSLGLGAVGFRAQALGAVGRMVQVLAVII